MHGCVHVCKCVCVYVRGDARVCTPHTHAHRVEDKLEYCFLGPVTLF